MRAVISGDWHIGANPRYKGHTEDIHRCVRHVVDYAIDIEATAFIIAGDGLHRPLRISQPDLEFLESAFFDLGDHGVSIYYVLGNHDSNRTPIVQTMWKRVSFESASITFIDRNNYLEEGIISPFGYTTEIVLLPYLLSGDPLPKKEKATHRLAVLHQTMGGVQFKNNIVARDMYDTHHERIFLKEDLDAIDAQQLLSGHIHKRHGVTEGRHRIEYMGSTCVMTFGEIGVGNTFVVAEYHGGAKIHLNFHDIPQRNWLISKGIPKDIKPDSVYKLILTKDEAETYGKLKHFFSEVGSQVASIDTLRDGKLSERRTTSEKFGELTDDEKLLTWLSSVGIDSHGDYLDLDREIRKEAGQ